MRNKLLGYDQALKLTLDTIMPLESERISLSESLDRILVEDLCSQVDSPSIDASMKDGYAVLSDDIQSASPENIIRLKVTGLSAAGEPGHKMVTHGTAVRILTGAKIPEGANAVLAEEFAVRSNDTLFVSNTARPGRNILAKGMDIAVKEHIADAGSCLGPGLIGLLAAAGYSTLKVFGRPKVAILATGDELVVPGRSLPDGKLYASNLEMLTAWCRRFGFHTSVAVLNDKPDVITHKISRVIHTHDAVITSGGAWTGDRDFVAEALDTLGWKKLFHRIRIGPGKAVGFGMLNSRPVFLLPGGPPSNLTGFLKIALPGLLKLGGRTHASLPEIMVKLEKEITCRNRDWTEFVYGYLKIQDDQTLFCPLKLDSRLKYIAHAQGVVAIPEGIQSIPAKAIVPAQVLV